MHNCITFWNLRLTWVLSFKCYIQTSTINAVGYCNCLISGCTETAWIRRRTYGLVSQICDAVGTDGAGAGLWNEKWWLPRSRLPDDGGNIYSDPNRPRPVSFQYKVIRTGNVFERPGFGSDQRASLWDGLIWGHVCLERTFDKWSVSLNYPAIFANERNFTFLI